MKKLIKNKMISEVETKEIKSERKFKKYFFPTFNITIMASCYDCAIRKLEDMGFVE
jgi:hypothetical protein